MEKDETICCQCFRLQLRGKSELQILHTYFKIPLDKEKNIDSFTLLSKYKAYFSFYFLAEKLAIPVIKVTLEDM